MLKYIEYSLKKQLQFYQLLIEAEECIPKKWWINYTIPIYKENEDAMFYKKHRGVRLLEQEIKLWEKILRNIVIIKEKQFGFQ